MLLCATASEWWTGDFNPTSFVLFATKPYFSIVRKFFKFVKRMKESLLVDCEYELQIYILSNINKKEKSR